jgi:hypothetical protein
MKKGQKKKETVTGSPAGEILEKVGASVKRETSKRSMLESKSMSSAVLLDKTLLVKAGSRKLDSTMSEEQATLKSLVQSLVKLEINKLLKSKQK